MLTVLFATRNGQRTLKSVLSSYCLLEQPTGGWKLIIVDNASTDSTAEIIASFRDRIPLRYLYKGTPGKNAALNAALPYIEGDIVVLTDDDVFPRTDWLVCLRKAADKNPDYSVFGGVVLPRWEIAPPPWVINWVPPGPVFTLTVPTAAEGPTIPESVYGPNMAVRAQIFRQGLRFDPAIGPRGANYAMGSETEFVVRLARLGHRCWHVANAQVEHFIRDFQLNRNWILQRAVRFGRGQYRLTNAERRPNRPTWRGIPRDLFTEMLVQSGLFMKGLASFDGEAVFRARWTLNVLSGAMMEARALHIDSAFVDMRPREA